MRSIRPARLIVVVLAALAITMLVNERRAFAQDTDDPAAGPDGGWEQAGPAFDEDAESAEGVLEIPQVACTDGVSAPCAVTGGGDANDADQSDASSPDAAPPSLDDGTADARWPDQGWGTVDEYQDQESYGVPYVVYPYPVPMVTMNGPSSFPGGYVSSNPLTPAARPPLNPGPWMLSPAMSPYSRPAGSPMVGMSLPHPSFAFHR